MTQIDHVGGHLTSHAEREVGLNHWTVEQSGTTAEGFCELLRWLTDECDRLRILLMEPAPPPVDTASARALWEFALERTKSEYAELSATWKDIDTKAQAAIAAAGVVIAATVALTRATESFPLLASILALITVLCFMGAIAFSVATMWVSEVDMPMSGEALRESVKEALADNDRNPEIGLDSHLVDLLEALQEQWADVNVQFHVRVGRKADRLLNAQKLFATGLIASALLLALHIIGLMLQA